MKLRLFALACSVLVAGTTSAFVTYVDWIGSNNLNTGFGHAWGSLGGVRVDLYGPLSPHTQIGGSGDINYWVPGAPYVSPGITAPTTTDIVRITQASSYRVTFTDGFGNPVALTNVIMPIVSIGRPEMPVTYRFSRDFSILSGHGTQGYWNVVTGSLSNFQRPSAGVLTALEGHGTIGFTDLTMGISGFSWTTSPEEYWHGFTFGHVSNQPGSIDVVPEPFTMALGAGALALAALKRRRRN